MNLERQLLVMMLGVPGSGKSYFARNLAEHLNMKQITADEVRSRLFGSINAGRTPKNHQRTYDVVNQAMEETLRRGESVVRDNQNNHRKDRDMCRSIAQDVAAYAVIVWVRTPKEIAIKRCIERKDTTGQLKLDERTANEFYDRSIQAIETPTDDENYVQIDGTVDFPAQFSVFAEHVERAPRV